MKNILPISGLVTVNDKGQIVIPVDTRNELRIVAGDKLIVMIHPSREGFMLMKPDGFEQFAKQMMEQVKDMRNVMNEGEANGGE